MFNVYDERFLSMPIYKSSKIGHLEHLMSQSMSVACKECSDPSFWCIAIKQYLECLIPQLERMSVAFKQHSDFFHSCCLSEKLSAWLSCRAVLVFPGFSSLF